MRPRQISDEEILEVARTLFLEKGPKVSTNVIAKALGVSQATLFKRFGTKQELMLSALEPKPEESRWAQIAELGPDDRPVPEQLEELALAVEEFMTELIPRVACIKSSNIPLHKVFARHDVPPPIRAHQMLASWFQRAMDRGQMRTSDPRMLAAQFMGGLHIRQWIRHVGQLDTESSESYVHELVGNLWRGIQPEEGTP